MLGSNNIADESGKWYAFEPDVSGIYADKFDKTQIKPTWYYAYEGDDSWSKLSDGYWLHGNEHQLEAGKYSKQKIKEEYERFTREIYRIMKEDEVNNEHEKNDHSLP